MSAGPTPGAGFIRRGALHTRDTQFGPSMTPMVDVVLVILVFFMASAAFIGSDWFLRAALVPDKSAAASAPRAPAMPPPAPDPLAPRLDILLDSDSAGRTIATGLDRTRVPLAEFLERLRALPKGESTEKLQLVIRPAATVPYEDAVRVHEACRARGMWRVGLGPRGQ